MSNETESWTSEKRSAYLYRLLAERENGTSRSTLFRKLAEEAEHQAKIWEENTRKAGGTVPDGFVPDFRTRFVSGLIRRYPPRHIRTILAAMKVRGMSVYSEPEAGHVMPTNLDEFGERHKNANAGNLRAAVFGVNDGLVSNASLILGVAGASLDAHSILLTGSAGLLAGALSMASGEYVSVRSQRELFEYQIGLERDELNEYPEEEAKELALIFEARGHTPEEAIRTAKHLISDPARALDTLTREELGLNPNELGSPWGAAVSSFLAFSVGAIIPLIPFLWPGLAHALKISIGLTTLSLFSVGAVLSLFTGKSAVAGGLRMLLIGSAAGAATFLIGHLMGVSLS